MAWPEDYFLPAKCPRVDTPITGDLRFYRRVFEQVEGCRLIVNEKAVECGLPEIAAYTEPKKFDAAMINELRAKAEACMGYCLNESVHPDGDISGVVRPHTVMQCTGVGYTMWTKAAILNYLGLGVGGDWTRMPARNIWGKPASGGTLLRGDPPFREHVNEILSVCNALNYLVAFAATGPSAGRLYPGGSGVSCDDAKSQAEIGWAAQAWADREWSLQGIGKRSSEGYYPPPSGYTPYIVRLDNQRGKLTHDFSAQSAGTTGKVYLTLMPDFWSYMTFGGDPPHAEGAYTWGEWVNGTASLIFGDVWMSPYIDESDTKALWIDNCPTYPNVAGYTWWVMNFQSIGGLRLNESAAVVVYKPDWTYKLP